MKHWQFRAFDDIRLLREPALERAGSRSKRCRGNAKLQNAIAAAIEDAEAAATAETIQSIKRLSGHREYYRFRIGESV